MRQRNKPWADDFLNNHSQLVIKEPKSHKNNWHSVFGNTNPVHLEIGTGKGQFLVGMAKQFPEINFIGIELAKSVMVTAAQKIIDSGQENILLLNENAEDVRELFGDNEISNLYLNFSDPWPKNKHEKRRLTYYKFLDLYKSILTPGGIVMLKTDNRGLFEYSLTSFSKHGMILEEVLLDLHDHDDLTNVMTEYEQKFSGKGQPIYRCSARF